MSRRPFRPSLENLEKREVFSASPLDVDVSQGYYRYEIENTLVSSLVNTDVTVPKFDGSSKGAANFSSRGMPWSSDGLVGDFNGDGSDDLAYLSGNNTWAGPVPLARDNIMAEWTSDRDYASVRVAAGDVDGDGRADLAILPYLEQDNLYKSSLPFSNTLLDDEAFVAPIHLDLLGLVARNNTHDALFDELGTIELDRLANRQGDQIIAVLIALLADGSPRGIPTGASSIAEITEGTSNTLIYSEVAVDPSDPSGNTVVSDDANASVTDLIIDPFTTNGLLNSPEYRAVILGSPEYYAIGGSNGGVWKTTNFDRGYISPY